MPDEIGWVTLYNPTQDAWHRVPDKPIVIQDFQDRGWETPADSAARAKTDAAHLRGKELEDALEAEGLPRSGTIAEKQKRLAEKRAEPATTNEENEGEQV